MHTHVHVTIGKEKLSNETGAGGGGWGGMEGARRGLGRGWKEKGREKVI